MRLPCLGLVAVFLTPILSADPRIPNPAFLDSRTEIRLALPTPSETANAEDFILTVGKQKLIPTKLEVTEYAKKPTSPATPDKVVLPGTIAPALGGNSWDPNDDTTRMTQVSPGIYELSIFIPGGTYEFKIARGGSWAENYGSNFTKDGQNIRLVVPAPEAPVKFIVNFNDNTFFDSINNPDRVKPPTNARRANQDPDGAKQKIRTIALTLPRPLTNQELFQPLTLGDHTVVLRNVLADPAFYYTKTDLGPTYTRAKTTFKVWSPPSTSAQIVFPGLKKSFPMRRGTAGVWYIEVPGDLHGQTYYYAFRSYGQVRNAADIYAPAASQLSGLSLVVDMRRTDPAGWSRHLPKLTRPKTETIIYELHVRDFTVDPASGIKPDWRGKYLGFTQTGTKNGSLPTGIDYLKWLGVTDIHILPFQNFNPDHSQNYNWGYETTLFNVPEEQYSTNPADPITTIRETKQMIHALHQANLRVILDVVYNHTVPTNGPRSAFDQTVPFFWFRTNDAGELLNESGVGNALHDERPMVRKYVRESLLFWLREYKLDGYRFDLIGMFTPDSVRDWADAMKKVRPDAVIYGEPWTGGGPTRFAKGAQRGMGVAVFNDNFRNAIRGGLDGPDFGFMTGQGDTNAIREGVQGSINSFAQEPIETINYVSAHDNLTLLDKITLTLPDADKELQHRALTLATAIPLLSQGVPFLEGGPEMGRTKGGNHNSYNAGDEANQYDWKRMGEWENTARTVKALIEIRKSEPAFRHTTAEAIRKNLTFLPSPEGTVAYRLKSKDGDLIVLLNGTRQDHSMPLPAGNWSLRLATDGVFTMQAFWNNQFPAPALTAVVLKESQE